MKIMQHDDTKYDILKECAQSSGWMLVEGEEPASLLKSKMQTIKWSDWPKARIGNTNRNHKSNCMPGIRLLCDKEKLSDLIEDIRGHCSKKMLNFVPKSWSLPRDMQSFTESFRDGIADDSKHSEFSSDSCDSESTSDSEQPDDIIDFRNRREAETIQNKDQWFIVKPSRGLQGRGIHICHSLTQIEKILRANPAVRAVVFFGWCTSSIVI